MSMYGYDQAISQGQMMNARNIEFNQGVKMHNKVVMDNFDTELVVMGIKMALTQYQLPIDPDAVKCFDEFHEKYGKYITAAQSIK